MVPFPAVSPRTKLKFILGFLVLVSALTIWTAISAFGFPYGRKAGVLTVKFYDVGQGDAILIEAGWQTQILVDGGPSSTRVVNYLSKDLPFWDRKIELLVLTHPHIDHAGGLLEVFRRYEVQKVLYIPLTSSNLLYGDADHADGNADFADQASESSVYAKFVNAVASEGAQNLFTGSGKSISVGGGVELTVLWPSELKVKSEKLKIGENINNLSIVLHLKYGDFDLLLPGDAEKEVQAQILGSTPDVEVLKVPHHGSSDAFLPEFWEKARSELAVIMVGKNNKYAHPNRPVLDYLENLEIPYFRTDLSGTITVESDGKTFWLR